MSAPKCTWSCRACKDVYPYEPRATVCTAQKGARRAPVPPHHVIVVLVAATRAGATAAAIAPCTPALEPKAYRSSVGMVC
eukprot:6176914-Pleurochrysis_carterae.AAC.6